MELVDVRTELLADDGKLGQRRVFDSVNGRWVPARCHPDNRQQQQEEREQGQETVIGQQGRQRPAPIISELPDHAYHEGHGCRALLRTVNGPKHGR
jgi:hypothetical protein